MTPMLCTRLAYPSVDCLWRWSPITLQKNKFNLFTFFRPTGPYVLLTIIYVMALVCTTDDVVACMNKLILAYM